MLGNGYVKFIRGTPSAFQKLATKDKDTLYFISMKDSNQSSLYIGDKLIADLGSGDDIASLGSLKDVVLAELGDRQILAYNEEMEQWINTSLEDVLPIMQGATETDDGRSGLVPVPIAGDHVKFLRGDGTWAQPNIFDNLIFVKQNGIISLNNFREAPVGSLAIKNELNSLSFVNPIDFLGDTFIFKTEVGDLNKLIITQDIGDTIVDQLNDVTERLQWKNYNEGRNING